MSNWKLRGTKRGNAIWLNGFLIILFQVSVVENVSFIVSSVSASTSRNVSDSDAQS